MAQRRGYDFTLLEEDVYIAVEAGESALEWRDAIFKSGALLEVEVGCGNGHFLVDRAEHHRDISLIGIDLKKERIVRCREKQVKRELSNMRWICGEALASLHNLFKENYIDRIYMTFPDPWPKKRHHKNRLFKKEFVDIFHSRLKPGGHFIFISDHEDYYLACREIIDIDSRFKLITTDIPEELTDSVFARKWKEENRDFFSFTIEKI